MPCEDTEKYREKGHHAKTRPVWGYVATSQETGKGKKKISLYSIPKEHGPADTFILHFLSRLVR